MYARCSHFIRKEKQNKTSNPTNTKLRNVIIFGEKADLAVNVKNGLWPW